MSRMELKEEAKKSLKGKYGQYILLVIVYSLLTSGVVGILTLIFELLKVNRAVSSPIVAVVAIIASALLTLGEVSFSLKVARNKEVKWTELFSKTSLWLTFIIASLLVGLFTTCY